MRPKSLHDLAYWAFLESAESVLEPPSQLHTRHYPEGEDPGHTGQDAIVGLPFTRAFQRYLDGERPRTPIRRALARMRSRERMQSVEYRICHAIVDNGQTLDHVQTILRCADAVMVRALSALYELTELEKAREKPLTGSVVQAT